MFFSFMHRILPAAVLALGAFSANTAQAGQIVLSFKEHDAQIIGEFVGFTGETYVVATADGNMNVPAQYVDCLGEDCLDIVDTSDRS